jgi:activator of HSP90 ATPase
MEGVGSIWNKNSWHWEEKNYTKKSTDYITEKLQTISVPILTPRMSVVKISKINECKGSAVISIRKKKQVYIYEFEVECEWEAEETEGDEVGKGKLKIREFYQDDDPEDVEIEVTAEKSDEYHDECRRQIGIKVRPEIVKVIESFKELIKQIDADEAKIRQDGEQRMKAEEETKKAEESKGTEKQAIFEEAKAKEQEMKANIAAMKVAAQEIPVKDKGTGSVWNANSYFWEEKNYNKWSKDKLEDYIGKFKHTVPGGSLEVTECEIEGEASISIRKGKKIYSYDFQITLKWTVTLKEGETESKVTGIFKFPEISNAVYDDDEEFQIDIEYKTGEESRDKIHAHIKGEI